MKLATFCTVFEVTKKCSFVYCVSDGVGDLYEKNIIYINLRSFILLECNQKSFNKK